MRNVIIPIIIIATRSLVATPFLSGEEYFEARAQIAVHLVKN